MKTLQCPVSDVTYSARDVVARVVRPKGVGIAASCGRARRCSCGVIRIVLTVADAVAIRVEVLE